MKLVAVVARWQIDSLEPQSVKDGGRLTYSVFVNSAACACPSWRLRDLVLSIGGICFQLWCVCR